MIRVAGEHGRRYRAVILPVVLLVLVLLGVVAASSSFFVYANRSAVQSSAIRFQARLAAEAGLEKVMLNLRTDQSDVSLWYDNPEEYHRMIVWGSDLGIESLGTAEEFEDTFPVYRFSIVADNPLDDEIDVRYGVTDESSKLNINVATRGQLITLFSQFANEEINVEELADALIDWRDSNTNPSPAGAEAEYYAKLDPPYAVKNAPFNTVEELLLVRGFSGALLYGEDYDRNGLLSPNEDDADETFPPDDGDGILNRGLYPYLTVHSLSLNRSSDNRPRLNIFGEPNLILDELIDEVDDMNKIEFITDASNGDPKIKSPAELLKARTNKGQDANNTVPSPITLEDMVWVMDRLTTANEPEFRGLININTAPPQVLATLDGMTEEEINSIVALRTELPAEDKRSIGWLASVVGEDRFIQLAPKLTARGSRFRVESLGYGDHVGAIVRLEAIVEMRGPIAQIVYNRDITMLGTTYPVHFVEGDPELAGFAR